MLWRRDFTTTSAHILVQIESEHSIPPGFASRRRQSICVAVETGPAPPLRSTGGVNRIVLQEDQRVRFGELEYGFN
jgi:hypothetical protein